nr:hypothetical protein [Tanacetum cinerariifolium]
CRTARHVAGTASGSVAEPGAEKSRGKHRQRQRRRQPQLSSRSGGFGDLRPNRAVRLLTMTVGQRDQWWMTLRIRGRRNLRLLLH